MQKLRNMGYNRFYINIILNVIFIAASCFACLWFLFTRNQPATSVFFGIISIISTGRLIYYINRTNRMLENFLIFMKEKDPTLVLASDYVKKTFFKFYYDLQVIEDEMKEGRIDKEIQAKYLQAIVENVQTGILTLNESGKITLINKAAKDYLGVSFIHDLSDIDKKHPKLSAKIKGLNPGEQILEKITTDGQIYFLSIKGSFFKSRGKPYTIITFQDIKSDLEEQEIQSWKKLIRIITHEIMNSITPITTLTNAIKRKLKISKNDSKKINLDSGDIVDALSSIDIIEDRSQGVIHFISQYQKLTKLPPLQLTDIDINKLFERIENLFKEQLKEKGITFISNVGHKKILRADKGQLEQMLINLVKNSIESLDKAPKPLIELRSSLDSGQRILLHIEDNGKGVPGKYMDQVFVPFFTTKESGSGIGLSLCKQIMRLHKGEISLTSEEKKGTKLILKF